MRYPVHSTTESTAGVRDPVLANDRVPAALARVRAISGEQLCNPIDFLGAMKAPGIMYLSMALKHSVHHRGQLSAYLRAMGGSVPGIYGPSADTQ